jgi:hypothetical protein
MAVALDDQVRAEAKRRIEGARPHGWVVQAVHRVYPSDKPGGDDEAMFVGHEQPVDKRGELGRPLTAWLPQDREAPVVVLEDWN